MWSLNLPIPSDIRHLYRTDKGKCQTHIVEALGTSDLREADFRKKRRIADLEKEFRRQRSEAAGILPSEVEIAKEYREQFLKIQANGSEEDHDIWHYNASEFAEQVTGLPDKQTPESTARGELVWRIANGAMTLNDLFDEWTSKKGIKGRTLKKYTTAFREFMNYKRLSDGFPEEMSRSAAIGYVDWLNSEGRDQRTKVVKPLSFNTKKDRVSALGAFWNGMEQRGAVRGRNPWQNLSLTERPTTNPSRWEDLSNVGRPKKREHLTEEDLLAILNASGPSGRKASQHSKKEMLEVFALALFTGARQEELCCRRLRDLSKVNNVYWLNIYDSKNASSDRKIPIVHPIAVALLDRLVGNRTNLEDQLFQHLSRAKTDGTYSRNIGKALQRFFAKIPSLEKGQTPYVTRHTFATLMGNREDVIEAVLKRYIGHADKSITDRHYRTITAESLVSFSRKVRYPDSVEQRLLEELELKIEHPEVA